MVSSLFYLGDCLSSGGGCELASGVNDVLKRPGKYMVDTWQRSQWVRRSLVPSFCYLGDGLSSGGGCELTSITRFRVVWGQFQWAPARPHLPLISHHQCVRSAMLHISKTWALTVSEWYHMQRNDQAMICWICSVTTKDQLSSQDLLERMPLDDLAKVLRTLRLKWHGHEERSDGWLKKVKKLNSTEGHGWPILRKAGQKWSTWTV